MSETKIYHIEEIMQMLPHRYPFLLVDRLEVEIPGEKGVGIKNVTMNEEFFLGHFPGNPVMPGVLQIEAMAQTAGAIVVAGKGDFADKKRSVLFMSIDGVNSASRLNREISCVCTLKKSKNAATSLCSKASRWLTDRWCRRLSLQL